MDLSEEDRKIEKWCAKNLDKLDLIYAEDYIGEDEVFYAEDKSDNGSFPSQKITIIGSNVHSDLRCFEIKADFPACFSYILKDSLIISWSKAKKTYYKHNKKLSQDDISELKSLLPEMPQNEQKHKDLRFNTGKPRLDLIPQQPLVHVANVLTRNIPKYGLRNWENGLSWTETSGSAMRHLAAYLSGEDFDAETGEYHLAHAATNILFLLEFYKTYPQGDDRNPKYINHHKIGLDIDEVLCDWVTYWTQYYNQPIPHFWRFDRELHLKMEEKTKDKDFWLNIPAKTKAEDLPFEPALYLTKHPIPNEWTQEWLDKNGFPQVECITIPPTSSKLPVLLEKQKEGKINLYVDDNYEVFVELNKHGLCCYLMNALHNKKYNVGYKRIHHLNDLM